MNRFLTAKVEAQFLLRGFVEENNEELSKGEMYTSIIGEFHTHWSALDEKIPDLNKDISESAEKKEEIGTEVAKLGFKVASLMRTYGSINGFEDFLVIPKESYSQYKRLSGSKLTGRCDLILDALAAHPEEATKAEIKAEDISLLDQIKLAYEDVMYIPRMQRKRRKDLGEEVDDHLDKLEFLIEDQLTPYMQAKFETAQPDLLKKYFNCIKVDKVPRTRLSLVGIVTNTISKEPVTNIKIYIDGKYKHKSRGKSGKFNIKHLSGGKHTVRIEKAGYMTFEREINILEDKTYHLEVNLSPISIN